MGRPEGSRNTLIAITYDTIGELACDIAGDTARKYTQRDQFHPRSLDSPLTWVNTRRTTRGLPMIGVPDADYQVASDDAPTTTSAPALPEFGTILASGPRTACFQQDL